MGEQLRERERRKILKSRVRMYEIDQAMHGKTSSSNKEIEALHAAHADLEAKQASKIASLEAPQASRRPLRRRLRSGYHPLT